ncbi:MAG: glycerophosphodiester phosphodiesterase family protein [Eubacteriales bacterium]
MKKRILSLALSLLAVFTVVLMNSCEGYGAPKISISFERIIHAGGELWGVDSQGTYRSFLGSNSLEGLSQCAEYGCNAVELDFNFTSDDRLVCIHDWSAEYIDTIENGQPLSYDEFMSSKIFWNFTPIGIEEVGEFLREHPEMYIVTDIKERFEESVAVIAETLPDLKDRIVIQIYSEDDYDAAEENGFKNIIFTLYRLNWKEKTDTSDLVRFERTHPLVGFTFSYELCEVKGYVDGMMKSGVPLYVHTVNDGDEVRKYQSMGIYGVYTDTAAPEK